VCRTVLQRVAVRCSVLQRAAVRSSCSALQCVAVCVHVLVVAEGSVLQCIAVCCAVCCSMLQCVSMFWRWLKARVPNLDSTLSGSLKTKLCR